MQSTNKVRTRVTFLHLRLPHPGSSITTKDARAVHQGNPELAQALLQTCCACEKILSFSLVLLYSLIAVTFP